MQTWSCPAPEIDADKLLGVHKYKDRKRVRPVIRQAASNATSLASKLGEPRAYFTVCDVASIGEHGVTLADETKLLSEAFNERLAGSSHLLAFVLSLGPALDAAVTDGFKDGSDPLGPLFLDTAGWLMIEAATRMFSGHLKELYAQTEQRLTLRMAPGYDYPLKGRPDRASWDLTEQQKLFALFDDCDLPVSLLESGAMIPRMTRSGVYGIKPLPGSKE